MRRRIDCFLCLTIAFLLLPGAAAAQQPSGGRNTTLEYLDRGFDLEGFPREATDYWNTPEGKARYEQVQLERFEENVEKLKDLGRQDRSSEYDPERRLSRELNRWAKDLEDVSDDIIKYLEWRFDAERLEPTASAASLEQRLDEVHPMVDQILETVPMLAGAGLPVEAFILMRQNLTDIHAFSRALRD